MRIGVTGWDGRLGRALCKLKECKPLDCDITDPLSVKDAVRKVKPNVIINCASLTQVDEAENNYDKFLEVNAWAVRNVLDTDIKTIQISTDYVFDGNNGPYSEPDPFFDEVAEGVLEPVNAYGWSKAMAEILINSQVYDNLYIVRTTGIYTDDWEQWDFLKAVVSYLNQGLPFMASMELMGNQTYAGHLAEALVVCAERSDIPRVLHIASREVISRYAFAVRIADKFGFDNSMVYPVNNAEVSGWVAKRPTKAGLKVDLAESLKIPIYTINEGLAECRKTYPK